LTLPVNVGRHYDVSPDGQRFLNIREGGSAEQAEEGTDRRQIIVVQNWVEELTRLVPVP
jgi:hypothetical protein